GVRAAAPPHQCCSRSSGGQEATLDATPRCYTSRSSPNLRYVLAPGTLPFSAVLRALKWRSTKQHDHLAGVSWHGFQHASCGTELESRQVCFAKFERSTAPLAADIPRGYRYSTSTRRD